MIDGIFIGLVILCVTYLVTIMIYASIGTLLVFIQLFFIALLLFLVYGKWYYARNLDWIPEWVLVSVVTICVTGVVMLTILCVLVFLGAVTSAKNNLDYVIVPGVKVKERTVNNSLRKRLDKAMEYAEDNLDTTLVLSEGKGPRESISETEVMYQHLMYNGIRPEQLLIEDRSESTVENIVYSGVTIEQHRKKNRRVLVPLRQETTSVPYVVAPDRSLEIGVFTNNFHIYRIRMTAGKWGFNSVHGISAGLDPVLLIHLYVKGCTSIARDRLMRNI